MPYILDAVRAYATVGRNLRGPEGRFRRLYGNQLLITIDRHVPDAARRRGVPVRLCVPWDGWRPRDSCSALNDEGIYLDGGLRVLHGQVPYKDFFSLTGPGTFALMAASFRVFGPTLAAARMPVVWDLAILTACLFWLVSKLSNVE